MPRRSSFNPRDATLLAGAAQAAGLPVHYMAKTANGTLFVVTSRETLSMPIDDLDRELTEFEARHGKD
jgi:hypothetical protein